MTDTAALPRLEMDYKNSEAYKTADRAGKIAMNAQYRDQEHNDAVKKQEREEQHESNKFETQRAARANQLMTAFMGCTAFARTVSNMGRSLESDLRGRRVGGKYVELELDVVDAVSNGLYSVFEEEPKDWFKAPDATELTLVVHIRNREFWLRNTENRLNLGLGTKYHYKEFEAVLDEVRGFLASKFSIYETQREAFDKEDAERRARNDERANLRATLSPAQAALLTADE